MIHPSHNKSYKHICTHLQNVQTRTKLQLFVVNPYNECKPPHNIS